MPIEVGADLRRLDDQEFQTRVYEVMGHIFDIHNELGRLFHEKIYQREVAFRVPDALREVPIQVKFEGFCKAYYLDLLIGGGVVFELKAVESLTEKHERQLLQYLFLTGLPHGKLVNLRPERVEHKFVNNTLTPADRRAFAVTVDGWQALDGLRLKERMAAALRDWGTGLDLDLYEEAAAHLCGQPPDMETEVEIRSGTRSLGVQRMRLAAPGIAIRVTALSPRHYDDYQVHLTRLLEHSSLEAVQWINVTRTAVHFTTVSPRGKGR